MALTKEQLATMYAEETGNDVATVEKQEPVQTTDVPVQEEENPASTSESSGDSSATQSTEETITLENGNQVVDGIEYTEEGIEIGAYTEGKTQQIYESEVELSTEQDLRARDLRYKQKKAIEARNRTKLFAQHRADDKVFNINIQKRQSEEAEKHFLKSEKFTNFKNNFEDFSGQKIQERAQEILAKTPNITEEEFNTQLTTYKEQLWGDAIAGSSQLQEIMDEAATFAASIVQPDIDKHFEGRTDELVTEGLKDQNLAQRLGLALGADPYNKGEGNFIGDTIFATGTSFDSYIVETFDSVVQDYHKNEVHKATLWQKNYDERLASGALSQEKYDSLTAENTIVLEDNTADYYEDFIQNSNDDIINGSLGVAVTEQSDPDFYTLRNAIISIAEQLPNRIAGLVAHNPLGYALGMLFYGQQLSKQYEEGTNRVIASQMFDVPENEVTDEQKMQASLSPRGLKELQKNQLAGLVAGSASPLISRLQLKGGNLGKFFGNKKAVSFLGKTLQRFTNTKLWNIGKYPVNLGIGIGPEIIEEILQEDVGDFRKDQLRFPEASTSELLQKAAERADPRNWSEDYKNIAAVTFLSAGGTTALSQVAGGIRQVSKVALDRKDILKLSKLTPEQFKVKVEIEKKALDNIINDPKSSDEQKTAARNAAYSVLDTEFAYNDLQNHPNINGNNRVDAMKLLQERAGLRRQIDLLGNSGLSLPAKEREKIIDEKLAGIQKSSREGETGSVFDKIRKAIGPKKSLGAARKETVPQKIANAVQKISNVSGDTVLSALERVYSRPQGIGNISSVARQLRHLKPDDISNDTWEKQINEAVNAIEETGEAPSPTLDADFKKSIEQDIEKDGTAEDKIGTRTQKKIEKFFHDKNLTVPKTYTDQFTGEYKAPEFKQEEAKSEVGTKPKNAIEAARAQTQAALDRIISQKEAERQIDAALSSAPTIGLAKRRNITQSIRNEGYKPNTITKPKSAIQREINQFDKNFKGKKNESKFAHLRAKLENLLAQVELTDQQVITKINELTGGKWDQYSTEVGLYEEALTAEAVAPEVLQRYSKELEERNTAMRKLYALSLRTIEIEAFNEGAESGVFAPGFDPRTRKFDFTFRPNDYKPEYAQYFGNEASYQSQNVNEWFNVLKDIAFIDNIQKEIDLLDVKGRSDKDAKRVKTLIEQRDTRKDRLEAKVKKDLKKTKKQLITEATVLPNAGEQALLEEMVKGLVGEDASRGTAEEIEADNDFKKATQQEGRRKAIDKQRPTRKKDLLYSDKKSQLETDLVYNALVITNKTLSDNDLRNLFSANVTAFAMAEHGLTGMANQANEQDFQLILQEYIELFGEENLAVLYEIAKEIRYLQDVSQRAAHGSFMAQAALIQSINPWIDKLVGKFKADTFRGIVSVKGMSEDFDSVFVAEFDADMLKGAAVDGAIKAIQNWDPSKGKFITYATYVVEGEMKAGLNRFTGKSPQSSIEDYNRQKLESIEANVSKAKLEIARYLYFKGIDEGLASDIINEVQDQADQLTSGLNEMSGNGNINSDPRVAPVLSDKLSALSKSLESDPRARKIAFAAAQISKLKKLAEIKDVDVSHFIGQYQNQIAALQDTSVDPSALPLITVPEGVLNTRGGYLDSGQNVRIGRFNILKALQDPTHAQKAELATLESGLTEEIEILVKETGGSISTEQYQNASNQNELIPQQIKEVEARIEESSFNTKSVLLATGPEIGVSPLQEEQIASNKSVVEGQLEVKKVLQTQMTRNNIMQLAAETGALKVMDSNGEVVNVTEKLTGAGALAKSNLNLGVYIPPITTAKEASLKLLATVSTLGNYAPLVETNDQRVSLINDSFDAIQELANQIASRSAEKQKEVVEIEKKLESFYNEKPVWDEELNMWTGGSKSTFADYANNTVHVNPDGSVDIDEATQAALVENPYALEGSTIFFTGLGNVSKAKSLLNRKNSSTVEGYSNVEALTGASDAGQTAEYAELFIAKKEVDIIQEVYLNATLLKQFKLDTLNGKNLSDFKNLVAATEAKVSEYSTFVEDIDNPLNDNTITDMESLQRLMANTVKIAANKDVGKETIDVLSEFTTISDEIGLPAPTEVPPKKDGPKSNSGKLFTFAPALVLLLPGVGVDFDAIAPILDAIGSMYDAVLHVASLVFGNDFVMNFSMASAIPIVATTPQQQQTNREIQLEILKEFGNDFANKGATNKWQVMKLLYARSPKAQSLWPKLSLFTAAMTETTGIDFPRSANHTGSIQLTNDDSTKLAALVEVSKLSVKEGKVYSAFDRRQTEALAAEINSIAANTDYLSQLENGGGSKKGPAVQKLGKRDVFYAINDISHNSSVDFFDKAKLKLYSHTTREGGVSRESSYFAPAVAHNPRELGVLIAANSAGAINKGHVINGFKLAQSSGGLGSNRGITKEWFGEMFDLTTDADRFDAATPSEKLQIEAMRKSAESSTDGTIPIYRGVKMSPGQSVNSLIDIGGWSTDPVTAKQFADKGGGGGKQATIGNKGTVPSMLSMRVKPEEILFIGASSKTRIEKEVVINPNIPTSEIIVQGDSNISLDTRIDDESNNDKICM